MSTGAARTRADAVRNSERVLRAAAEVLAEKGAEAGIPEIALRAGVGKGTVYRCYPTKEHLVGAVVAERLRRFTDEVEVAASRPDAWEAFVDLLQDSAERQASDRIFTDGLAHPSSDAGLCAARAALYAALDRLMARAQDEGRMRRDVSSEDVRVLFAGMASRLRADGNTDAAAWRRYAGLVADALRGDLSRGALPRKRPRAADLNPPRLKAERRRSAAEWNRASVFGTIPAMSRQAAYDRAVHARLFAGLLGDAGTATPAEVAGRAGVSADAAKETLAALAREGLLEPMPGGAYRALRLDSRELRELYPAVLLLEAVAVRDAPAYTPQQLDALRDANAGLRSARDAEEGSKADDEFHRRLTANCGNPKLLAVVDPVRRALIPYERVYFASAERRARSADQHDEIIAALGNGDHDRAAALVRENFTTALPDLTAELDARRPDAG